MSNKNSVANGVEKFVGEGVPTGHLREMSAEEYKTFNDPAPGTDSAWDTLTESEKAIFRTPQISTGKTLSDLLKDRAAIDMGIPSRALPLSKDAAHGLYPAGDTSHAQEG